LHFDKVVLGADGFDLSTGLSTHFEAEASLNRLMCEVAREVIVVTDSSKFARRCFHLICAVNQVHTLVTDAGIPTEMVEELTRMGVQVHLIS
jgi:DeoR family transcriptional regulator of aga operon